MRLTRNRLHFFVAFAMLLAIFAGCKGESPTAPPATGGGGTGGAGNPPGGGVTPPTGANVVVTVSNPTPLVDSVSTITATVTQNGQPVANGTAVEFNTNLGTFTDTSDTRTIRTTTNGVTSAILTSPEAGVATVSVTVNNVTKNVTITFSDQPVVPPTPSTAPTIATVTPNTGSPAGGTSITITGTNFRTPVRVLVDAGPAGTKEAFVVSVTPTQIVAITPSINLTSTQTQAAAITVIVDAGNPGEARVTRAAAFTYVTSNLTPVIRAISPGSGGIEGGTRVTIIGDAFDAAGGVQVFFGAAQAQIISVNFSQIIVMSPTARDTAPNGSGAVTGPVTIKVLNIASGKSVTAADGFRYTPKMQVTLLGPNQGPFSGGTRFTVDGTGFDDPLTVTLAGVGAQIIKVTGTQIIGISNPIVPQGCSDVRGPTVVTNGNNGDFANGPEWIYRVSKPIVTGVSGTPALGQPVGITVANADLPMRIEIGGKVVQINSQIVNPDGTITFGVNVPTTLTLDTRSCGSGTTAPIPTAFDIKVTSLVSSCADTAAGALTVNPQAGPVLIVNGTLVPFVGTIVPPVAPAVVPTVTVTPTLQTLTIVNTGFNPNGTTLLTVNSISGGAPTSGTGCSRFQITATPNPPTDLDVCQTLPVNVTYNAPTTPTPTPDVCTLTISTNAGVRTFTLTGTSQ